jgi:hypothetical protein
MKKPLFILSFSLLVLFSCSSDDEGSDSSLTTAFFTINRNGQSLRQDVNAYGIFWADDCSDSDFLLDATMAIEYLETSEFEFAMGIITPNLKSDIDNNLSVNINPDVFDRAGSIDCFLLYQFIPDYFDSNYFVFLDDAADNVNNIVEIAMISESSTDATYAIRGNYNLTYSDGLDYSVNITGEYVLHVDTLK